MKRLALSFNGGGALGIGPAYILTKIEQYIGKQINQITHAYAGTSTGAIIAACLDEGLSGHTIFDLYKNNLDKIFTKYAWYKRALPTCPTYDNTFLKGILKEELHGRCSEWLKPIYLTTTFMNGTSEEKVWDTGDTKVDKWFAVLSSTAAPTYFDTVFDSLGNCFCDGGMWANDPIMTLVAGLKNEDWDDFKVLSFNTGFEKPHKEKGNKTLVQWASYIMNDWVARAGNSNYYEACAVLGKQNVYRCSPYCSYDIKMDDTSSKTIEKIITIWDDWFYQNKHELLAFINC